MTDIQTIEMSVDKFMGIQDNPSQRDTMQHAKTAAKKHLKTLHPSHAKVVIAKNGRELWKVDGHTRCYLWLKGALKAPGKLSVDVYNVKNRDEAAALYDCFDNAGAVENKRDQVIGAIKYWGIKSYNPVFARACGIINASQNIDLALGQFNPYETVRERVGHHKKQLTVMLAQSWQNAPGGNKIAKNSRKRKRPGFNSTACAAFLVTQKLHGNECLGFWDAYVHALPNTAKSGMNASSAAVAWILNARANHMTMGRHNVQRSIVALLTAYNLHRKKKTVKKIGELYSAPRNMTVQMQLGELLKKMHYK
jgi:hypothetical protein